MKYISFDEIFKVNIEVPVNVIFNKGNKSVSKIIDRITWVGSIKPQISDKISTFTDTKRYEEIQLLSVELKSRDEIMEIGKTIYKAIKYPCIIEFNINEVTSVSTCTFDKGKIDSGDNVNLHMYFSHWLRQDFMSLEAKKMIESINHLLKVEKELGTIMSRVSNEIACYSLGGISKSKVGDLVGDLVGSQNTEINSLIKSKCVPYKFYPHSTSTERYNKAKRGNKYVLIHDYEELWYCFMKDERTSMVIKKRRYRNIEDLIYSIENRYEEYGY